MRTNLGRGAAVLVACVALLAGACSSGEDAGGDGDGGAAAADLPPCPLDALDTASTPVEVTVWHFLQARTRDALEQLAAEFNASQDDVVVKIENQGTSNEELWSKYLASAPSGDLPGIAVLGDTVTVQLADSGTVLPAQSCIEADDYDMSDFLPGAQAYYTIDGVLYPATLDLSAALLYYNRNHFTKAGLDPDDPGTLEEIRTYAEAIKAAGVVDKPVVLQLSPAIIEMFLTGDGIPIVDNDNGHGSGTTEAAAFDTPEAVEFFTWVRQMIGDELLDALPQTSGQVGHYLAMAGQTASMTIETSTAATSIEAFLEGDLDTSDLEGSGVDTGSADVDLDALDIGAAPVPGIGAPGRIAMGGGAWYITATSPPEVQAAAWEFVKYFNEASSQVTWNLVGGYLPYRMSAVEDPRLQEAWTTTRSGQWLAAAYDELLDGVDPDFPGPLIGPYDQFREIMRSWVEQLIYQDAQPADVVTGASDETTEAIVAYNEGGF